MIRTYITICLVWELSFNMFLLIFFIVRAKYTKALNKKYLKFKEIRDGPRLYINVKWHTGLTK